MSSEILKVIPNEFELEIENSIDCAHISNGNNFRGVYNNSYQELEINRINRPKKLNFDFKGLTKKVLELLLLRFSDTKKITFIDIIEKRTMQILLEKDKPKYISLVGDLKETYFESPFFRALYEVEFPHILCGQYILYRENPLKYSLSFFSAVK